ncbi:hypothetical protein PENSTE_c002G10158 [Penicillium steckii]|uniref:Alpha-1,2-mannosyltransferase n=1 Tax=Penicillium steckii TaxID=303698 RepID=A0A1V6TWV9_9EURO|nr:hypothetical protein PENSTE_c002G10158 [Penicillium steckii]
MFPLTTYLTDLGPLEIGFPLIVLLTLILRVTKHSHLSKKESKDSSSKAQTLVFDPLGFRNITPCKELPLHQRPDWPRYWKPGKFQMTMALRKLDINNWFKYDELFDSEHKQKVTMATAPDAENYVDYLDGIDDAVVELLDTVVTYVTKRYPNMVRVDDEYVYIDHLQEKYRIREPYDLHPLAVAGLLIMDDLYVLKKGHKDRYTLRGAFLACPSGWRLQQRIGWQLHQIHDPVPMWKEKLRKSMERFFVNLQPSKAIQRNNLFIQPVGQIFHVVPFEENLKYESIDQVHIRTELQSLTRLPRSEASIFTVRTYLTPMSDLRHEPEQLEALWDHTRNFPPDTANYKCHHLWGDVFEQFCQDVLGKRDTEIASNEEKTKPTVPTSQCPAGF